MKGAAFPSPDVFPHAEGAVLAVALLASFEPSLAPPPFPGVE